jgi:hypothetical protein
LARRSGTPAALGLVVVLGFLERLPPVVSELRGYWGVDDRLQHLEQRWDKGPALMLVEYGGGRPYIWRTLPQTSEPFVNYVVTLRRGMWFDRRGPLLTFAEYQPQLVDELVRRWPDRPAYLMVLHEHRNLDYIVPLGEIPREAQQVLHLPVPQGVPFTFDPVPGGVSLRSYYEP